MAIPPAPTSLTATGTANTGTLNATMVTNGFLPSGYSEFLLDGQPVLTKPGPTAGSGVSVTGSFIVPDNGLRILSCRNRNSDGSVDLPSGSTKRVMGLITVAPPGFSSMVRLGEHTFRLTFDSPVVNPANSPYVQIQGSASYRNPSSVWVYDSTATFTVDSTGVLVELDTGISSSQISGIDVRISWVALTPGVLVRQSGPESGRSWVWNSSGGPSTTVITPFNPGASGGWVADLSKPVTFRWTRNSGDGSGQTWFSITITRDNATTAYTYSAYSSDNFITIPGGVITSPPGTGGLKVSVTTRGLLAGSDAVSSGTYPLRSNPTPSLIFVAPAGSVVNSNKYVFQFQVGTVADDTVNRTTSYTAVLKKGSTLVETKPVILVPPYPMPGVTQSVIFDTVLEDGQSYSVEINAVTLGYQETGYIAKAFTTSFTLPGVVSVASCVEDDSFNLLFVTSAPATSVDRITWSRSIDGGVTWSEESAPIARVGTTPFTFTDGERPLAQPIEYRITSYSIEGGIVTSIYTFSRSEVYMSGMWSSGPNLAIQTKMRLNDGNPPKADPTVELQKEIYYFAGRTKPVEIAGKGTSVVIPVQFIVLSVAEKDKCLEQALLPGSHLIRMPDNLTYYCSIGAVSTVRLAPDSYEISFTATEVER